LSLADLQRALRRTLPTARLDLMPLQRCGDLRLALINADFDTGPLPPQVMTAVIAAPAYWAFCWGSGLALAQEILARPELVRGQRILDFGAGSGVAGIAAARAGAAEVIACDIDADARLACAVNARLNQVSLTLCPDLASAPADIDRVLVADVLYDRSNLPLLNTLEALAPGRGLLIADSRIEDLLAYGYRVTGERTALTLPNLGEFDEFRTVRFFERSARADAKG
jgi:predicted nicotinamide N-methyase